MVHSYLVRLMGQLKIERVWRGVAAEIRDIKDKKSILPKATSLQGPLLQQECFAALKL